MRYLLFLLALLAVGCGGNSPTGPSPSPAPMPAPAPSPAPAPAPPPPASWNGIVTDTATGAPLAGFTALLNGSRVTISASAYVTRETAANSSRVDLFPEAGFSLPFYRQLARAALDGRMETLQVLPQAPAFYLEVEGAKGFSSATARRLEAVARRIVPQLTGGRFQVVRWETGPTARSPQLGWIMIERRDSTPERCASALVGALAGSIWLGSGDEGCWIEENFAHELGHAFGFYHVDRLGSMMLPIPEGPALDAPSEIEMRHMALAYARPRGNRDVDIDPIPSSQLSSRTGVSLPPIRVP